MCDIKKVVFSSKAFTDKEPLVMPINPEAQIPIK